MRIINFIIVLSLGLSAFACKTKNAEVNFGYEYFPARIGSWVSYEVDSISHQPGNFADTVNYQIKEVLESSFTDDEGRPAIRIERFYRSNSIEAWWLKDVWKVIFTTNKIEKVEENVRYVRLVFPIRNDQYWDGNALNTQNAWNYSYRSIGSAFQSGNGIFSETIEVDQQGYNNLIEKQVGLEVYAKEIGLVHKSIIDLQTKFEYSINPTAANINGGYELTMTYLNHGQN